MNLFEDKVANITLYCINEELIFIWIHLLLIAGCVFVRTKTGLPIGKPVGIGRNLAFVNAVIISLSIKNCNNRS